MPQVNPDILRWARETAGLSLEEASATLGLGGKRQSGSEALQAYEQGREVPSRPLVLRMTKAYRRPLLTFYLPHPPKRADRGEDFRSVPEEVRVDNAPHLDALVRDIHVRQRLVRSALEESEEAHPLTFVGSLTQQVGIDGASRRIQEFLRFDLREFRRQRDVGKAFGFIRDLVERTGIFVLLIGNLGSHQTNVSAEVFRGFALSDDIAPFIVINDQDARSAWAFTLLHELVHIFLGVTGISGGGYEQGIERFCNDVASELLLPNKEIASWQIRYDGLDDLLYQVSMISRERRISSSLVLYRFYLAGKVSRLIWVEGSAKLRELWIAEKAAGKLREAGSSGPNYYVVRRHRVGGALVDVVRRTLADGTLTPTKAGKVLGVKPTNVETLLAPVPA